ncbi:hypothetical protein [Cohaesibacter celericrescens]|uniref:DUF2157 domain-containing protein n=1 Tax=Cohaesibacter celericrescens TaxID=2067669 RepID=A0A2N5XP23_9HYPH|nr:hypothetical protein [Cohaesibacter celericrescens]PLW76244.1 hypothetical protein C0081_15185 [Cohaesibacter celericrescens]
MINHELLHQASERGLIDKAQIAPLLAFLTGDESEQAPHADPEEMHFARGFHDIFISIGLVILFAGYFFSASLITDDSPLHWFGVCAGAMTVSWLLAEWLSKKLRLSLPSILLTGAFVTFSTLAAVGLVTFILGSTNPIWDLSSSYDHPDITWLQITPFVFGLVAGWGFYKRFSVPITPAFLSLVGIGLFLYSIAVIDTDLLANYLNLWLMAIGVGCLVLALWFDMQDPLRRTVNSDTAFWLHLVAASLIVHSILSLFVAQNQSTVAAIATIVTILVIGLFALVIDRRALLASAIGYLGFAIAALLDQIDLGDKVGLSVTLLVLGIFVLMLGSGWSSLRGLILRPFAKRAIMRLLPPISPKGYSK